MTPTTIAYYMQGVSAVCEADAEALRRRYMRAGRKLERARREAGANVERARRRFAKALWAYARAEEVL